MSYPAFSVWFDTSRHFPRRPGGDEMLIDCDSCAVRGLACGDCVVTVLLGAPPEGVELDPVDRLALDALAEGGLVPRLRLVPVRMRPDDSSRQAG